MLSINMYVFFSQFFVVLIDIVLSVHMDPYSDINNFDLENFIPFFSKQLFQFK